MYEITANAPVTRLFPNQEGDNMADDKIQIIFFIKKWTEAYHE